MRLPFRRARRERELDEEIRSHLAMAIRERIARGEDPVAAEQAARREFGNVTLVQETTRAMWGSVSPWAEELARDIRLAVRSLVRAPGFALVAVITLGLGIGANTAVFTVVNGVLLRPLPFRDPGQLVVVSYAPLEGFFGPGPALFDQHYLTLQRYNRSFQSLTTFHHVPVTLTGAGEPVRVSEANVTPEFFTVLGVTPVIGRGFVPEEANAARSGKFWAGADVAVISDKLWRTRFGADTGVLRKTIDLDGHPYSIIGVTPAGFDFPVGDDLWVPMAVAGELATVRTAVGRLRPGVTAEQAHAELATISKSFVLGPGADRTKLIPRVLPLRELFTVTTVMLNPGAERNTERPLLLLAGAVAFVLLIACLNVANLMLIRATARKHEIAVRAALGASRGRLVRQLLTENVLLCLAGAIAGIPVALIGVRALLALAPPGAIPLSESVFIDVRVLAFAMAIGLFSGLTFGLVPALRSTHRRVRTPLVGPSSGTVAGRHVVLSALAVGEIALALILLTGAGLLVRSFLRLRLVELGFRPESVMTMTVDLPETKYVSAEQMHSFRDAAVAELALLPGSVAAGAVNWRPLSTDRMQQRFTVEGQSPSEWPALRSGVSGSYFRSMGIPVIAGRPFTEADGAGAPAAAIVSQSMARRLWPNANPLGKRIGLAAAFVPSVAGKPAPTDWLTIVGVVGDVVQVKLTDPPPAAIYQPLSQVSSILFKSYPYFMSHVSFTLRTTADPLTAGRAMRNVIHGLDREVPVEAVGPLGDVVSTQRREPLFQTRLLIAFSLLALVLAVVGTYGVLAYLVTERARELGIRIALGAQPKNLLGLVVRRGLLLASVGTLVGLLGSLALTRILGSLLYSTSPTDPIVFLISAGVLVGAGLVASYVPARRSMLVDPVEALRAD